MADIFDVVADPTRRDLLQLLLDAYLSPESPSGELSVGELVERLQLSQPTVSKHLKVLRDHGVVAVREDGQHHYYSLDAAPLEDLEDWLIPFLSADFDPVSLERGRSRATAGYEAGPAADIARGVGRAVAGATHAARLVMARFRPSR